MRTADRYAGELAFPIHVAESGAVRVLVDFERLDDGAQARVTLRSARRCKRDYWEINFDESELDDILKAVQFAIREIEERRRMLTERTAEKTPAAY